MYFHMQIKIFPRIESPVAIAQHTALLWFFKLTTTHTEFI